MSTDLFKFFDKMNSGDYEYIDSLTDEEVKSISPFVLLMWVNGAQSNEEIHIILTNVVCNPFIFSLYRHPRLLLKLFIAANSDIGNTRYKFTKNVSKDESGALRDIARYYKIGLHEAEDMKRMLTTKELKEIREEMKNGK